MREYIELKPNQKLISELGWLENLNGYHKDKFLMNNISKVSAINNIEPHVNELWESFLNLARVIDKRFRELSWYITDTELKISLKWRLNTILNTDFKYIEKELNLSYFSEDNSVKIGFTKHQGDEKSKKTGESRILNEIIYFAGIWEIAKTHEPFNEDDIEDVFNSWLNDVE